MHRETRRREPAARRVAAGHRGKYAKLRSDDRSEPSDRQSSPAETPRAPPELGAARGERQVEAARGHLGFERIQARRGYWGSRKASSASTVARGICSGKLGRSAATLAGILLGCTSAI